MLMDYDPGGYAIANTIILGSNKKVKAGISGKYTAPGAELIGISYSDPEEFGIPKYKFRAVNGEHGKIAKALLKKSGGQPNGGMMYE
ncbi:hypothetical protein H4Q26_003760 [Puccinia striiformis f. sp. tritici PST-130]|nr:hypothetical protein H4Q26_003760 [Puccinia striiformis f. sp. tritici PST-130]